MRKGLQFSPTLQGNDLGGGSWKPRRYLRTAGFCSFTEIAEPEFCLVCLTWFPGERAKELTLWG